ncbi:MAG: enoyl-CoA hydratase/isomerase family protein [Hyphomicrobiales bacterium]|nr:enoyl-CoA hydratase/isomerase family protein [Hyphomicrobiales bacterium]
MTAVRLEKQGDVALAIVDNPPVNALSQAVRQGILDCIGAATADSAVKAIVLACEGRSFIAGADIKEFGKPPQPPFLPDVLGALEASGKPVVAAIHGTALGGGFEVALACHARVADARAKIGLPEVKLGLIPGAGGTQRLPRLAGVAFAIDVASSGRMVGMKEALAAGVIDKIADGDLRASAVEYARTLVGKPPRRTRDLIIPQHDHAAVEAQIKEIRKKARGAEAPVIAAQTVMDATHKNFDQGLADERKTFMHLLGTDQSKAMRYVFFAEREVLKTPHLEGVAPRPISRVGVIGSGTMGAGITISLVNSGMPVTVVEMAQEALDRGHARMKSTWERDAKLGRISAAQVDQRLSLLTMTTDFNALADCDLVIEAVFEEMAIKKDIFTRLGKVAKPGAVLASNTSYLDINAIGAFSGRPADVIGMHFFSPANIMRLVEIIEGAKSAKDAVATGVAVGKRMGKLPVVMGVCDGFVGNRILAAWRPVADMAVEDGAMPHEIDAAMEKWGMAMGGFAVGDLAGLDIGMRRRREFAHLRDPEKRDSGAVADAICALGRYGQKTGAGYYKYVDGKREVDPIVTDIINKVSADKGIARRPIAGEKVMEQIHATMVNEAAHILSEGIVSRPLDVDMVLLNGYGFPAWRGGPLHEADRIGLDKVLATMREVHKSAGKGYEPAPLLEKMVAQGKKFADLKPGDAQKM